jgi:hypothetical protein
MQPRKPSNPQNRGTTSFIVRERIYQPVDPLAFRKPRAKALVRDGITNHSAILLRTNISKKSPLHDTLLNEPFIAIELYLFLTNRILEQDADFTVMTFGAHTKEMFKRQIRTTVTPAQSAQIVEKYTFDPAKVEEYEEFIRRAIY